MPKTRVVFFQAEDGSVPVLEWIETLPRKAQNKCLVRIEKLEELGFELRRPLGAYLRDGIYELRARLGSINYRILYGFKENTAVLLHGLTKEAVIKTTDIDRVLMRLQLFSRAPRRHSYHE